MMKKRFIADLHIHSKYSRAVSQNMNIPTLFKWGKIKGINLIGTGDFTHPFWVHDLKQDLEKTGNGFYKYKEDHENKGPFFILTSEISCIYSQGGKTRKIHLVFFMPSIEKVEETNKRLAEIGNITSDGRPILGISAEKLVETILKVYPEAIVIPAHIWTPWFSLFGANSGFDSLEECFGKMSQYIYAIETGLSSDPLMNWRIKDLYDKQIVSFSDAHSPAKLGREATVFESEFSFEGLRNTLMKSKNSGKILYTIEFFPEEGKYHFTGHRNCGIRYSPEDLKEKGKICPVCGRTLTVGVVQRVEDLAKIERKNLKISNWLLGENQIKGIKTEALDRPPYVMMVPLQEIIAEALEVGVSSQKVQNEYHRIVENLGPEFHILLVSKKEDLLKFTSERVVEGILKIRNRDLNIEPGFDGEFGKVKIWGKEKTEEREIQNQMSLF